MKNPQSILITGASSGIGEALARHYAADGVHLFLNGRDQNRLEVVQDDCTNLGAKVDIFVGNVTDETAMAVWLKSCDQTAPLDLVIANAGIGVGTDASANFHLAANRTFDTNVNGVFNTIHPALEGMLERGRGQIAIVSSLAAFRGLAGTAAYSGSKAAVLAYGEGMRGTLADSGVEVSVVCPGYVRSRLTDRNDFKMPFFMEADKAVDIIARGLEKNKGRIVFPWPMMLVIQLALNLPSWLWDKLNRPRGNKREEQP